MYILGIILFASLSYNKVEKPAVNKEYHIIKNSLSYIKLLR